MRADYKSIGQSIPKIGVKERLRGEPIFCADLDFDDAIVLKLFRSTRAHANLVNIDYGKDLGQVPVPGMVVKMSRTPGKIAAPSPLPGQDNEEIYGKILGYHSEHLQTLTQKGII